jgi:hypothetical protein
MISSPISIRHLAQRAEITMRGRTHEMLMAQERRSNEVESLDDSTRAFTHAGSAR